MTILLWLFILFFLATVCLFLRKKIQKACAIAQPPVPLMKAPTPENTLIVFDIHGVLFRHDYPSMFKQLIQAKLFIKLIPCLLNKKLIIQALRLARSQAVPEAYMVGLAQQFTCLKPHSITSIAIANTQIPQQQVWEIVHRLKKQGYTLHILSNIGQTIFEDLRIKHPEIFAHFDAVKVASVQEAYRGKPHPTIFKKYLADYNAEHKQVIFIDDKPKNVAAAKSYGMNPIFFCCATHLQEKLNALGV